MSDEYREKGDKVRIKILDKLLKNKKTTDPYIDKDCKSNPYAKIVLRNVLDLLRNEYKKQENITLNNTDVLNVKLIGLPGISIEDI